MDGRSIELQVRAIRQVEVDRDYFKIVKRILVGMLFSVD